MPTYEITDVSQNKREWSSQLGGPMVEYRVHLANGDERHMNVEWSRKATSPAPTAGQQVEGTLEDRGSHGMKLKVAPAFGGGNFGPRPEDPARAKRIVRQHSQEMSLRLYLGLLAQGVIEAPGSVSEALPRLRVLTDAFERDAMGEGS